MVDSMIQVVDIANEPQYDRVHGIGLGAAPAGVSRIKITQKAAAPPQIHDILPLAHRAIHS